MRFFSSYNRKWLFYTVTFLVFFTSVLLIIQYRHEKSIRIEALNDELNNYASLAINYIQKNQLSEEKSFERLDSLTGLIEDHTLRITVISPEGAVWYDSSVEDIGTMENHLNRPEVRQSLREEFGTDIRVSATTKIRYYYYARYVEEYFIRISVIFDLETRQFIKPDTIFMLLLVIVLFITSFSIVLINDKFGKSVHTLKEFTSRVLSNKSVEEGLDFPDNELGSIGQEIIEIYRKLNQTKETLLSEREKLIRHLNMLEEGIAIFSKDMEVITNNKHFMQFINHISDSRVNSPEGFFNIPDFEDLFRFIYKNIRKDVQKLAEKQPVCEISLSKGGKYYNVKSMVFPDKSFEVSIQDVTRPAKRKLLKQELTENIAHELKTPVSSIRGLLETIIESNPPKEKAMDFLHRAYAQACRLSHLVNDISLLTKIEEAGSLYEIEAMDLRNILKEIEQEMRPGLDEHQIELEIAIGSKLMLKGNPVLMYSVFRNLMDNAVDHGGEGTTIRIEKYAEDEEFYYFSFSDDGRGVPDEDLPRLFERFYRVDKGRDRKRGGTGLGLAIVKNAIEFHKGTISVKNRSNGGLEFLFTLFRNLK
ncbi:MAG: two-component sensor histidine kinase [Bacteroidales bacterium]|nr:two-component sensor histidine kinase [Bacteroidales bacterium]